MQQAALTLVVPVRESVESLREHLGQIEQDVRNRRTHARDGARIPFADLTTIHFARFALLEASRPDERPKLLFATVHDGPRAQHVNELVTVAGEGLLQVFALCDKERFLGKPREVLRDAFKEFAVRSDAFWAGHPGCSVAQIRKEERLRKEIRAHLGPASGRLSRDPFAEAVEFVRSRDDLRWGLEAPPLTRTPWHQKAWHLTAGLVVFIAVILSLPVIRCLELLEAPESGSDPNEDPVEERKAELEHKRKLLEDEDHDVQNQLTTISDVKPALVRLLVLRGMLFVVGAFGRGWWDRGALSGIRTIHFARWFLVKQVGGWKLIFFSNYDRSWESYLGEFVDEAPSGLTGIWSNTLRFPPTRWLFRAGARSELKFKRWVRSQQEKTQVWYSAYPDLSVLNVQNNAEIRRGLQGLRGLEERRTWLRRL